MYTTTYTCWSVWVGSVPPVKQFECKAGQLIAPRLRAVMWIGHLAKIPATVLLMRKQLRAWLGSGVTSSRLAEGIAFGRTHVNSLPARAMISGLQSLARTGAEEEDCFMVWREAAAVQTEHVCVWEVPGLQVLGCQTGWRISRPSWCRL